MSDQPDVNLTPSVEEFVGWYNLQGQRDDGLPVLRSAKWIPEFEHAEFFELYPEAAKWCDQLVTPRQDLPFDPLADPPFFVRSDADDRTLDVDADFQYLNVWLLHRIQKQFLGRYPLWRVILVAEHPSCSIAIYPTAIRIGNRPVDVDLDEALRELIPRELALREAGRRLQREHLARMQQLLLNAVQTIADRSFLVCGVLDNYEGDYSRLTICVLVRGSDDDAVMLEGPVAAGDEFLWRSSVFGVSAEGTIVSWISVPAAVPFCLVPWLPPADYRGPLTIIERDTGERHIYELKSENITRTIEQS